MRVVTSCRAMQRLALDHKRRHEKVALVPTMGYLHAGHLSLVRRARKLAGPSGLVVVSIYVNPTQFGPDEDLANYPRDWKRDRELCRAAGVDVVFRPDNRAMYPGVDAGGHSTYVRENRLSSVMDGAARPGHFEGVTTIVAKLFNLVLPDAAVFGAKDFQQAAVITRMTDDLNFPVRVVVAPTVRERDGLAMSSRNKYLTPEQRAQAVVLSKAIQLAREEARTNAPKAGALKRRIAAFCRRFPLARLDYVEIFDPVTLTPVKLAKPGSRLALAVFLGDTRLIDNGPL